MWTPSARASLRHLAFLALLAPLPAAAQSNRVFVSAAAGNDANPCNNINTPCQTFQGAVNQVAAGGSVIVLTTGGYGAVTIAKALTIEASTGVTAFIHPASGAAITVNAGASDVVVLRGLSLNVGTGDGITFSAGGTLQLERCVLNGFAVNAINHYAAGLLVVKDTTIRNSYIAINVGTGQPPAGISRAVIERTRLKSNHFGVYAYPSTTTTIRASSISGNSDLPGSAAQYGLLAESSRSGETAEMNVEDCLISHNWTGVGSNAASGGIAIVRVSNSTLVYNTVALRQAGSGTLLSRVNNTIEASLAADVNGTVTPFPAK